MPVPTLVTDLSTTLASNSPAGSDNVFPDLDNYLRALSGFVASIRDNSGNGWVSPYLPLTYSAGTANGVVYLNGSKVVTTGSGLVFDGTNLGIGTSSPSAKLHVKVGTNQNLLTTSTSSKVTNLAVDDAGSGYVDWQQYANQFLWFTASTQRMALDASGNLGIGTSSPSAKLQVVGGQVLLDNGQFYGIKTSGGANNSVLNLDASNNLLVGAGGATVTTQLWTGGAERMRLDSSGNLGIGTTSPAQRLDVVTTSATVAKFTRDLATDVSLTIGADNDGAIIGTDGVNVMRMFTGGSERARITSAGDLLMGLSAATFVSTRLEVQAATNNNGLGSKTTQNNYAPLMAWNSATTGDNLFQYFYTEGTLTLRGSITYNRAGGLVAYNTTSDYRAKDIIGPVQDPGATIDALKVYEGRMKGATQSRPMLIAHEAQAVAPYAVSGVKDEVNEDGTPKFQQMDVSSLVPLLIAEIQSLRARVAALEAA